jgi:23S rRNA pseudouridine1911/1915/1917 synthase
MQQELSRDPIEMLVEPSDAGGRLDAFLAQRFPLYSRVMLRNVIAAGGVTVNGERTKVAYRLRAGQKVVATLPDLPRQAPRPENIPLEILYEDEWIAAINKPPGMVVHPSRGHWSGTLTAALAFHFEQLSEVGGPTRPGVVHRLDRDTSGVLVVAKKDRAHMALAAQFEARTTEKEYFAIVSGRLDRDRDVIEQPIGAHPHHREKMAIRAGHSTSRDARTFYEVAERFDGYTAVRVFPKTGRTHQIRVHLAHVGHPILCDKLYGGRAQISMGEVRHRREEEPILLDRMALHARRLKLTHPLTGEPLEFEAPLRADLEQVLTELRQHRPA